MQDNGNGRITMAILGERMDQVLKRLDTQDQKLDRIDARLATAQSNYDVCHTQQGERWKQHEEEHQTMGRKSWAADIIGPVLAAIVAWWAKAPTP